MEVVKKIGLTVAVIFLLGIIVTALYEKGGVAPGDGPLSFILFVGMIVAIIFIWKSKKKS